MVNTASGAPGSPARRGDRIAAAAWLFVGVATLLTAILTAYVGGFGAPYWDQWQYTDPDLYLRDLLERHNGHPMLLGRLAFAIDYTVFGAQPWWLQTMTFLTLAGAAAGFVALARRAGLRTWTSGSIVAGLAATMLFNPQGWENLRWGFQLPFVAVFAAAVGGAYALASHAEAPRPWTLALSLACAALAIVSLANGIIFAVLLVAMAALLRLPLPIVLLHAAVALLGIPVLLAPSGSPGPDGEASLLEQMVYVPRYLGGGLGTHDAALVIGAMLVLGSAAMVIRLVFSTKTRDPARAALAVLILFIGATAALTAFGRASLGPEQALSSRYALAGGVLIVALALLVALEFGGKLSPGLQVTLLIAGALASSAVPMKGLRTAHDLAGRQRDEIAAQTALVVDVRDEASIGQLSFDTDLALTESRRLRRAGKWHFADQWSRAIGQRVDASAAPSCPGVVTAERPAGAAYVRLGGFIDAASAHRGRIVVIARDDGAVIGYGRVPHHASDLLGGVLGPARYDWRGHARVAVGANPRLNAYAANPSAIVCRIGAVLAP